MFRKKFFLKRTAGRKKSCDLVLIDKNQTEYRKENGVITIGEQRESWRLLAGFMVLNCVCWGGEFKD